MFKFLSFINTIYIFYFVNVHFDSYVWFDVDFIEKNNVNGNKNNFGTAVLIQ